MYHGWSTTTSKQSLCEERSCKSTNYGNLKCGHPISKFYNMQDIHMQKQIKYSKNKIYMSYINKSTPILKQINNHFLELNSHQLKGNLKLIFTTYFRDLSLIVISFYISCIFIYVHPLVSNFFCVFLWVAFCFDLNLLVTNK
jgi:hypothetical protein